MSKSWYLVAALLFVAVLSFMGGAQTDGDDESGGGDAIEVAGDISDDASDFYRRQAANLEVVYLDAADRCDQFGDIADLQRFLKPLAANATNAAFEAHLKSHFSAINGAGWDQSKARVMTTGIAAGLARHK